MGSLRPVAGRPYAERLSAGRIELQLEVSGYANEARALISKPSKGVDACHVGGHEFRQIEFERSVSCTRAEQFWNLRDTQPARQPDDASIGLLNDTDPAFHEVLSGKTQATNGPRETGSNTDL